MELLLVRIDHLRDRKQYTGILRGWLQQLGITNGRLITVGELHLLFIAADAVKQNELLARFRSEPIDTNSRDELCVDRFIDVLGRKQVDKCACKSFLEMNILNETMLRKLLVQDWQVEDAWVDAALATPRSKAFLEWRDAAKAARRDRRKRSAQERTEQRAAKKIKQEQGAADAAEVSADKAGGDVEAADNVAADAVESEKEDEPAATAPTLSKQMEQEESASSGALQKKKRKRKSGGNKHKE